MKITHFINLSLLCILVGSFNAWAAPTRQELALASKLAYEIDRHGEDAVVQDRVSALLPGYRLIQYESDSRKLTYNTEGPGEAQEKAGNFKAVSIYNPENQNFIIAYRGTREDSFIQFNPLQMLQPNLDGSFSLNLGAGLSLTQNWAANFGIEIDTLGEGHTLPLINRAIQFYEDSIRALRDYRGIHSRIGFCRSLGMMMGCYSDPNLSLPAGQEVYITGHSLGGFLAQIITVLRVDHSEFDEADQIHSVTCNAPPAAKFALLQDYFKHNRTIQTAYAGAKRLYSARSGEGTLNHRAQLQRAWFNSTFSGEALAALRNYPIVNLGRRSDVVFRLPGIHIGRVITLDTQLHALPTVRADLDAFAPERVTTLADRLTQLHAQTPELTTALEVIRPLYQQWEAEDQARITQEQTAREGIMKRGLGALWDLGRTAYRAVADVNPHAHSFRAASQALETHQQQITSATDERDLLTTALASADENMKYSQIFSVKYPNTIRILGGLLPVPNPALILLNHSMQLLTEEAFN